MVRHRRGQLGSANGNVRIQTRVYRSTSGDGGGSANSASTVRGKEGSSSLRTSGTVEEKSSVSHSGEQVGSGFFGHFLFGAEKNRRLATNNKSASTQSIYNTTQVPYGVPYNGPQVKHQRQVGHINRSERCLPAHSYSYSSPPLAPFQDFRSGLLFQMSPIWVINCPPRIYEGSNVCSLVPTQDGCRDQHLLRRLAYNSGNIPASNRSHSSYDSGSGVAGFHRESNEITPSADSNADVSRSGSRSSTGSSYANPGENRNTFVGGPRIQQGSISSGVTMAPNFRPNGEHGRHSPLVSISDENHPDIPQSSLQSSHTSDVSGNTSDTIDCQRVDLVETSLQPSGGSDLSKETSSGSLDDGRLSYRLGGSRRQPHSKRSVERIRKDSSHQHVRTVGSSEIPQVSSSSTSREDRDGEVRQHNNGGVHQSPRRDSVSDTMSAHSQYADMVQGEGYSTSSSTHSRSQQHSRRQSVTGDLHPTNRMVSIQNGSGHSVRNISVSEHRSVCLQEQSSAPSLLLKGGRRGSIRNRCHDNQLERSARVRLSTNINGSSSNREDIGGTLFGSSNSSPVATSTVVRGDDQTVSRDTAITTHQSGSAAHARVQCQVSQCQSASFSCVAAIKRRYRKTGLSCRSAELVAKGRRQSTLRIYSSRLRPYFVWCKQRNFSPHSTTVAQIADFLCERFERGIQASTARGYLSAIMAIHENDSLHRDSALKLLIEGMHNTNPPRRKIWPAWDLDVVLDALNELPFEPIRSASLLDTSIKTAFLVTLASGRRSSEIHALSIGSRMIFSKQGVTMYSRPSFLAKNERSNFSASPISLPSIPRSVGKRHFSCPVRAIKWYMNKTEIVRKKTQELFIISTNPHTPASRTTIARWVVEAIVRAKATSTQGRPNAHSTRATASTTAMYKGVTVNEIVNTVSWKTSHVFISTYLKDKPPQSANARFATSVLAPSLL